VKWRVPALARRLVRVASPLLLAVAIVSYGAELAHLRGAREHATDSLVFTQLRGSAGVPRSNATREHASESVTIDARRGPGSAIWHFSAIAPTLPRDTTIERADAFVTDGEVNFTRSDGSADIAVDGRNVAHLRARPVDSAGVQGYVVANADAIPVDIPPHLQLGFRVPLDGEACRAHACTVVVAMHHGIWVVRSVALLFATRAALGPATWTAPVNVALLVVTVLALALLSHSALSLTQRSEGTRVVRRAL
jgi:hypothetical protein